MSKLVAAILLFGLAFTGPARAEDKGAAPVEMPWEKACDPDIKKLCAQVKDDVRPCLAEHEKELSKGCTRHFSAAGFRVALACAEDFDKFCAEAAVKNKLPECINAKLPRFAAKCRTALTAAAGPAKPAEKPAETAAAPAPRKTKRSK